MTSAANKYPAFFKYFHPEHSSERLLIPIAFATLTRFDEMVPDHFILINYSGKGWQVEARQIDGKIYIDDGWKCLVEENCLEEERFIVFEYEGSNRFKFKVYEIDGCQKIGEKDDRMEEEEESKEEEEEEEEEETDGDSDEEFKEEHAGRNHLSACKAPVVGKRGTAGRSTNNDSGIDAVKYVNSDNPYFIAKLNKGRPNELHIPKNVIDDFSLNLPQTITLLCCQHNGRNEIHGRKTRGMCTGKVDEWKDGRVYIKGWASFSRKNNINVQNNACICEFVLGEDQEIEMLQVHVVSVC